jgi:hypothetical protein
VNEHELGARREVARGPLRAGDRLLTEVDGYDDPIVFHNDSSRVCA